jgi:hypothetical protein
MQRAGSRNPMENIVLGPGEVFTGTLAEVKRLTALGYLVNAQVKPIPRGAGPTFTSDSVVQVKRG